MTFRLAVAPLALAFALTPVLVTSAHAASPASVSLGTADSFALLAGSTITNIGATTIAGDIGLCCTGRATPGFGSVTQTRGALTTGPGTPAATAQDDLDIAYGDAAGRAVTNTVGVDLSLAGTPANPLLPGVYQSTSHGALRITTGLTLDFQGNPNAVFIFQGTDVVTAAGAAGSVHIVNGGATPSACNIFWQLSDATQGVTLGTNSAFKGTTMALGASVLGSGATVEGRILTRRSKQVTLDNNTITQTPCQTTAPSGGGASPTEPPPTPPPTGAATPAPPAPTPTGAATPASSAPTPTGAATPASAAPTPHSTIAGLASAEELKLHGPSGPVSGPFTVSVTGGAITKVTFYVDGKRTRTVTARPGRKKFSLKINPRHQNRRVHHVIARVRTRTGKTTLRFVYRRPAIKAPTPRFTG